MSTFKDLARLLIYGTTPHDAVQSLVRSIGHSAGYVATGTGTTYSEEDAHIIARLPKVAKFLREVADQLEIGNIPVSGDLERIQQDINAE